MRPPSVGYGGVPSRTEQRAPVLASWRAVLLYWAKQRYTCVYGAVCRRHRHELRSSSYVASFGVPQMLCLMLAHIEHPRMAGSSAAARTSWRGIHPRLPE
jgi:hypothetical protein